MRKSFFIISLLILIVFISGCVGKECKTNDDCLTKNCFTVQCKDNKCVYSPIANCCGNERCEVNETYPECAVDCPDCDDYNDCTIDKYDYHEQECVNKIIIPCCGNGICDEDAETHLNCLTDCPDCDDNNKLTTDNFNYITQECENIVTHYFFDDFESGIENWLFYAAVGEASWSTVVEDGNTVLRGRGHIWADPGEEARSDYIFKFRFKRIKGSLAANFRVSENGRYLIHLDDDGEGKIRLHRRFGEPQNPENVDFEFDKDWHTFEIRGYGNILNIYMDDRLLIKYKDEGQVEGPLLSGKAAFENGDDSSEFLIDDVEIKVITEKDIIFP